MCGRSSIHPLFDKCNINCRIYVVARQGRTYKIQKKHFTRYNNRRGASAIDIPLLNFPYNGAHSSGVQTGANPTGIASTDANTHPQPDIDGNHHKITNTSTCR
jgi:hypothetical protein